jgi:MFS family permease
VALSVPVAVALGLTLTVTAGPARADQATDKARAHYETGLELFYAREHAQALVEFQRAHEVKPRPATLFMMGQCEYLLGAIRQARDHYQAYLSESANGEFVEVAKDRVESINRRPATLVINTVPDQVDVRITAPTSPSSAISSHVANVVPATVTGQSPNNFMVTRGRWSVAVSKPNYLSQQMTVEVDVADTKPLFFKLEPIPARLEVETLPAGAALYVNGNRALNPYRQNVPPGRYEIFAEATNYEDRTGDFVLGPGEKRLFVGPNAFRLRYVQRSGRPELVFASALMGGLVGAGALAGTVAAAQESDPLNPNRSAVGLILGGAVVGTVGGALVANRFVPSYIPDNRALFVIGGMWIGAAEGMLTGMVVRQAMTPEVPANQTTPAYFARPALSSQLKAAFIGSLPGIVVGTAGAALLTKRAPTYGRVALIQSAAVGGAVMGGLAAVALRWNLRDWKQRPEGAAPADASLLDLALPALVGLNVGLAGGLLGAYMPDQSRYGPSWQRIALIDLAAGATGLAFGIGACVQDSSCLVESRARGHTAALALLGGGIGFLGGILLTRNVDEDIPVAPRATPPPSLTVLPTPDGRGGVTPTIGVTGFF